MGRIAKLQYTLRHKKAFLQVEKALYSKVSLRGILHDLDKVFMYPILGVRLTSKIHKNTSRHHKNKARTVSDYKEMIVDWECARITKPDKPLNAYDTLYRYYPELEGEILPLLKELGIAQSER